MASHQSIARLHREPEREQAKSDTVTDSQVDVPEISMLEKQERSLSASSVRGRFVFAREEPVTLDAPDLMSTMHASTPADRSRAFAALAAQDMAARWLARRGPRGGNAPPGPLQMQA